MTDIAAIDQIEMRRSAIGLKPEELADLAGIGVRTLYRMRVNPRATRLGTFEQLDAALAAREQELLVHLIALHPAKAREILSTAGGHGSTGGGGAAQPSEGGPGRSLAGDASSSARSGTDAPDPAGDLSSSTSEAAA